MIAQLRAALRMAYFLNDTKGIKIFRDTLATMLRNMRASK